MWGFIQRWLDMQMSCRSWKEIFYAAMWKKTAEGFPVELLSTVTSALMLKHLAIKCVTFEKRRKSSLECSKNFNLHKPFSLLILQEILLQFIILIHNQ